MSTICNFLTTKRQALYNKMANRNSRLSFETHSLDIKTSLMMMIIIIVITANTKQFSVGKMIMTQIPPLANEIVHLIQHS